MRGEHVTQVGRYLIVPSGRDLIVPDGGRSHSSRWERTQLERYVKKFQVILRDCIIPEGREIPLVTGWGARELETHPIIPTRQRN